MLSNAWFLGACNKQSEYSYFNKIAEKEQMIIAAKIDGIDELKKLVPKHGTEVKDDYGRTLLQIAAESNNVKTLKYLLMQGAKIDSQCNKGRTPLYSAISVGNIDICQLLLKEGANPNIKTKNGFSPLHRSAFAGNVIITKLLLTSKKIDLTLTNDKGQTFADIAQEKSHTNILDLVNKSPINRSVSAVSVQSTQSTSSISPSVSSAPSQLSPPPVPYARRSPSPQGTLKHSHSSFGLEMTQQEIDNLIDIGQHTYFETSGKNNVLHCIAAVGNASQANIVITSGIQVDTRNSKSETALHIALAMNNNDVAEILIQQGANIDATITHCGNTPLIVATIVGNAEGVRMLLDAGANIDKETEDGTTNGQTAILCAAHRNYDEIVEMYLARNAERMTSRDFLLRNVMKVTEALAKIVNSAAVEFAGAPDFSDYINIVPELDAKKEDLYKKIINISKRGGWIVHRGAIEAITDLEAYDNAINHLKNLIKKYKSRIENCKLSIAKYKKDSLSDKRTQTLIELEAHARIIESKFIIELKKSYIAVREFFDDKPHKIKKRKEKPDLTIFAQLVQLYKKAQSIKDRVDSKIEQLERQERAARK